VERRLAPPAAGEVQVAIEAAGVAYADIMIRQGVYAGHRPPITPGYDLVGRVEAIGPEVRGLAVGQRVAGIIVFGSYATRHNVAAFDHLGAAS
jgi:NADPH:quinone reductase-like Zn-dependent oxidoreductase